MRQNIVDFMLGAFLFAGSAYSIASTLGYDWDKSLVLAMSVTLGVVSLLMMLVATKRANEP